MERKPFNFTIQKGNMWGILHKAFGYGYETLEKINYKDDDNSEES